MKQENLWSGAVGAGETPAAARQRRVFPGMFGRIVMVVLPLAIMSVCLFSNVLNSHCDVFHEFQAALLPVQWMLLVCMAIWCGGFIFLTFSLNDLSLIGLLLIAISVYFISYTDSSRVADAIILLVGVALGKSAFVLRRCDEGGAAGVTRHSSLVTFLIGLIVLLAFSSWWHLNIVTGNYHGQRWMGLWDNPNIYGMLMGAGVVLAAGLLTQIMKEECRMNKLQTSILFIAAGMMGVGLFFSYSRGAWVGTAVGLLYLAKVHGKLKWKYVVLGASLVALGMVLFWGRTADTDAWYLKRLDLSRPSAQHRVSAWRGALQMMRDHPLGVGWNKAVETYDKNYSPPEDGAAALTMNSYLMLGTELGLPGLVCFVGYVWLALTRKSEIGNRKSEISPPATRHSSLQAACRAGALMLLVAFWFDGGLFTLATASVFWILLELSQIRNAQCGMWNQTNLP